MRDDLNGEEEKEEEVKKGPLSSSEISGLRHMLNDYFYRKRIRKMLKVWVYTIGTVTTMMLGGMTLFKEIVSRFMK